MTNQRPGKSALRRRLHALFAVAAISVVAMLAAHQPPTLLPASALVGVWVEDTEHTTVIDLVNWSAAPARARLTLFAADGRPAAERNVQLAPASTQSLGVSSVLADATTATARPAAGAGGGPGLFSLVVDSRQSSPVVAVARVLGVTSSVEFSTLVERAKGAAVQRAVWWRPTGQSDYRLVIANPTHRETTVVVSGSNGETMTRQLTPREVAVMDLTRTTPLGTHAGHLTLTADAPGVRAMALSSDRSRGLSTTFTFENASEEPVTFHSALVPVGEQSRTLGLRVPTRFTTLLALSNPGVEEVTTRVTLRQTAGGQVSDHSSTTVALPPGASRVISVQGGHALPNAAFSLEIDASHPLLAKAVAVDRTGDLSIEVPLVDPQSLPASFNNPWRVSAEEHTVLALTNVTDEPRAAAIHVRHPQGDYLVGGRWLAPGEVLLLDLRDLRDRQVPDQNGDVLPADATGGFVTWYALHGTGTIVGRTLVINETRQIATSYSCPTSCDCPPEVDGLITSPASIDHGVIGQSANLTVMAHYTDGSTLNATQVASYSGYNPSVLSVNSGSVSFVGPGSTTIQIAVGYVDYDCFLDANEECQTITSGGTRFDQCPVRTQIPTSLALVGSGSLSGRPSQCSNNPRYWIFRDYEVRDQLGQPIRMVMQVNESFTTPQNTCGDVQFAAGGGSTTSDGRFRDNLFLCDVFTCDVGGSCTIRRQQKWTINSMFDVANFTLTYSCSGVTVQ